MDTKTVIFSIALGILGNLATSAVTWVARSISQAYKRAPADLGDHIISEIFSWLPAVVNTGFGIYDIFGGHWPPSRVLTAIGMIQFSIGVAIGTLRVAEAIRKRERLAVKTASTKLQHSPVNRPKF